MFYINEIFLAVNLKKLTDFWMGKEESEMTSEERRLRPDGLCGL